VGPLQGGLAYSEGTYGLRGGALVADKYSVGAMLLVVGFEEFKDNSQNKLVEKRDKDIDYWNWLVFPGWGDYWTDGSGQPIRAAPCYTQIEAVFGLGFTVRAGFNPGELLDFLLGWFGIDIYGDDLEARKLKEEPNKATEATR